MQRSIDTMTSYNDRKNRLRILVIGSLPPPLGGTTVLLRVLAECLGKNQEVELRVFDTGMILGMGLSGLCRFGRLIYRLCGAVRNADVVTLHCCSSVTLPIFGSMVLLLSRCSRRPFIYRKFAGDDYRATLRAPWAWVAEFVLRHADLYLVETHHLMAQAKERGLDNVRWFPNHRLPYESTTGDCRPVKPVCRRFLYVGHVRQCKGLRVLVDAAKQLPTGVTVDVYGPWFDDLERNLFDTSPNIQYRGVLAPDAVVPTMREYDAFVLPTHHDGEGYPGAIIEAYAAGLPVITTRWLALPEIVDESVGILVEPRDAGELCQAMTRLAEDTDLYQRLRANTREKAEFFSAEHWAGEFAKYCRELRQREKRSESRCIE